MPLKDLLNKDRIRISDLQLNSIPRSTPTTFNPEKEITQYYRRAMYELLAMARLLLSFSSLPWLEYAVNLKLLFPGYAEAADIGAWLRHLLLEDSAVNRRHRRWSAVAADRAYAAILGIQVQPDRDELDDWSAMVYELKHLTAQAQHAHWSSPCGSQLVQVASHMKILHPNRFKKVASEAGLDTVMDEFWRQAGSVLSDDDDIHLWDSCLRIVASLRLLRPTSKIEWSQDRWHNLIGQFHDSQQQTTQDTRALGKWLVVARTAVALAILGAAELEFTDPGLKILVERNLYLDANPPMPVIKKSSP